MSFRIGRIGLDIEFDPSFMGIRGGELLGRRVEITGELAPIDPEEAKSLRNELWNMTENNDLVIPVISSADPSLDGYYRLLDASIGIQSVSLGGWYPFQCQLERFGSGGRMAIESRIVGGIRANDHGITLAESIPIHAIPNRAIGYQGYSVLLDTVVRNADNRSGGFDKIRVQRDVNPTVSPVWQIAPGNFYEGAAYIKTGSTLREMAGLDSENFPNDWEIGNGLIRIVPNSTGGLLDIEVYNGAAVWESRTTFRPQRQGANVAGWHAFTIIRNDPAAITIRLTERITGGGDWCALDITIRRGSFFAEFRMVHRGQVTLGVQAGASTACTPITPPGAAQVCGLRQTDNDTNGHRWVIGTSKTHIQNTSVGSIRINSIDEWDFVIGFEFNGSGAAGGNTAEELFLQYIAYITEYMNPVLR